MMMDETTPKLPAPPGESDNEQEYTLEGLLAGVTDENLHPEADWGWDVGLEVL
ncbi:MAG: hypothetical protein AB1941_14190 [Gemmatimonadota bacterium]